jgi:hypothetical protein
MTEIPHDIIEESVRLAFNFRNVDDLKREIARVLHAERLATSKRVEEEMLEWCAIEMNDRGVLEQRSYGIDRGTQNYFRGRDAIRALPRKYGEPS